MRSFRPLSTICRQPRSQPPIWGRFPNGLPKKSMGRPAFRSAISPLRVNALRTWPSPPRGNSGFRACKPESIDYLLLCTQSPDYFLPTTACLIQDRLGIPNTAGALDFNLGCSGYIYGLGLAEGLISTGQASNVLLLTAETYSKFLHPCDRSTRTIFGDAAAATLRRR